LPFSKRLDAAGTFASREQGWSRRNLENPRPLRFKIQQTLDGSKLVQNKALNGQSYARGQQASLWFQEIGIKALNRRKLT